MLAGNWPKKLKMWLMREKYPIIKGEYIIGKGGD